MEIIVNYSCKRVFMMLFLFLLSSVVYSQGAGTEVKESITWYGSDANTSLEEYISDPDIQQLIEAGAGNENSVLSNNEVYNLVSLGVDHKYEGVPLTNYRLQVTLDITLLDINDVEQSTIEDVELIVTYTNGDLVGTEPYRAAKKLPGGVKAKIEIQTIMIDWLDDTDGLVTQTEIPENAFLQAYFVADRDYFFDFGAIPNYDSESSFDPQNISHHFLNGLDDEDLSNVEFNGDPAAGSTDVRITWPHIEGAEFYELEWTYVNDYGTSLDASINPANLPLSDLDFKHNSTRISTSFLHYDIPLTFDRGYVVYRVRGVGKAGPANNAYGFLTPGRWSSDWQAEESAVSDWSSKFHITNPHEIQLNWQLVTTFAEDGKKKEVISYYDGLNRNRQVVTRINSEKEAVAAETIYDYHGRAAINILPVPTGNSSLDYYRGFNTNLNGDSYSAIDFDQDAPGVCGLIPASEMSNASGASAYYSSSAAYANSRSEYTPNANGFPFSQVAYTPDNTGRIAVQGGVGEHHQLNGRSTKYFYNTAEQYELDRLFGYEVGYSSRYKKNIVVDPNNQVSVSYVDAHGRTVATALAGVAPENVEALDSQVDAVSKNVELLNDVQWNEENISSNYLTTITPVAAGENNAFDYTISPLTPFVNDCMQDGTGFNMVFDLEYHLTDVCGNTLTEVIIDESHSTSSNPIQGANYGLAASYFDSDGNYNANNYPSDLLSDFEFQHQADGVLQIESYYLSRSLTLNEAAMDIYADHYVEMALQNCLAADISNMAAELQLEADIMAICDPCESCLALMAEEGGDISECDEFCVQPSNDWCTYNRENMLYDVSPEGQYAVYASLSGSLFFPDSPSNSPDFQTGDPLVFLINIDNAFKDELGNYSYIELEWINDESFYPEITENVNIVEVLLENITASNGVEVSSEDINAHLAQIAYAGLNVVLFEGRYFVSPKLLSGVDTFSEYWEESWAETLLPLHPEYCYLESCETIRDIQGLGYSDSEQSKSMFHYENFLSGLTSDHPLFNNGYLNLAEDVLDNTISHSDPLFSAMSDSEYNSFIYELMNIEVESGVFYSIFDLAATSGDCTNWYGNDGGNCTSSFNSYQEWKIFLGLYLKKRQETIENLVLQNGTGCTAVLDSKEKRFWPENNEIVPDNEDVSVLADNVWNQVNYNTYVETGNCPLANSLFQFLKYLSNPDEFNNTSTGVNHLSNPNDQPLLDIPAFNYMLYNATTDGDYDSPYLHPVLSVSDLGTSLEISIEYGSTSRDITLNNIPPDLTDLNQLRFLDFQVLSGTAFEVLAEYGENQQVVLSGVHNMYKNLDNCLDYFNEDYYSSNDPEVLEGEFYETFSGECGNSADGQQFLVLLNVMRSIDLSGDTNGDAHKVTIDAINFIINNADNDNLYLDHVFLSDSPGPEITIGIDWDDPNDPPSDGCDPCDQSCYIHVDPQLLLYEYVSSDVITVQNGNQITISNSAGDIIVSGGFFSDCFGDLDLIECEYISASEPDCEFLNIPFVSCNESYDAYINGLDGLDDSFDGILLGISLGDDLDVFNEIGSTIPVDPTEDFDAVYTFPDLNQFCDFNLAPYTSYYLDYLNDLNSTVGTGLGHLVESTSDPMFVRIQEFAAGNYQLYTSAALTTQYGIANYIDYLELFSSEFNDVFNNPDLTNNQEKYEAFYEDPYLLTLQQFIQGDYSQAFLDDYIVYMNSGVSKVLPIAAYYNNSTESYDPLPVFCSTFPTHLLEATELIYEDDCEEFAQQIAAENLAIYISTIRDELEDDFRAQYKAHALTIQESLVHTRADQEFHRTLYYYDLAGNLIKTTPPKGVVEYTGTVDRDNPPPINVTAHNLNTIYKYNTLNQLVWQSTPDGGVTRFWYDELGRLSCSQNAEQALGDNYSYTLYDELGRISEVGEFFTDVNVDNILLSSHQLSSSVDFVDLVLNDSNTEEVVTTYYDEYMPSSGLSFTNTSENTRNRVTSVAYSEDGDNIDFATHYDYDIHGNVRELVQEIKELEALDQNFKSLEYNYDLVSGNVHKVTYQRGKADQFSHKYQYDGDNRITDVYTSEDMWYWTREAKYYYYKHGPLERVELGDEIVQGTDYAYTIHGWLKGVNSNQLEEGRDMGKDGHAAGNRGDIPTDEFGFSLGYFYDDYNAIGEANAGYSNWLIEKDQSDLFTANTLHNGNISHMVTSIREFMSNSEEPQLMGYEYDQLNRIKSSTEYVGVSGNAWSPSATDDYSTAYTYDANGNILNLIRNGFGGTNTMDDISYTYAANNNQLLSISDGVFDHESEPGVLKYENALKEGVSDYTYDAIGNLISDSGEHIVNIEWTVTGKVAKVDKADGYGPDLEFKYDAMGNRVVKIVKNSVWEYTYYIRDAQGNVMSTYQRTITTNENLNERVYGLSLQESHIYGSSRLGYKKNNLVVSERLYNVDDPENPYALGSAEVTGLDLTSFSLEIGHKSYESSNHLGNVLTVVTDKVVREIDNGNILYSAILEQAQLYYPFGMVMPGKTYSNGNAYRYGFNGMEKDDEIKGSGNSLDFGSRVYDPRLGRFFSVDPINPSMRSPYSYAANSPIAFIDVEGEWPCWSCWAKKALTVTSFVLDFTPIGVAKGWIEGAVGYSMDGTKLEPWERAAAFVPFGNIAKKAGKLIKTFAPKVVEVYDAVKKVGTAVVEKVSNSKIVKKVKDKVKDLHFRIKAGKVDDVPLDETPPWKGPVDYSDLPDHPSAGPGKDFTKSRKDAILEKNREANDGFLRSDEDGSILDVPVQSKKGVPSNMNQAEVDHINPKSKGGSNSNSNAQVLSKKQNIKKSNKPAKTDPYIKF